MKNNSGIPYTNERIKQIALKELSKDLEDTTGVPGSPSVRAPGREPSKVFENNLGSNLTRPTFKSPYTEKANAALDEYLNYKPFEYDVNADKLYQDYVDLYTQRGQLASEDAIGQAAALTGGFGNSYAATAGSQAYLQYMQELNAMAPEFEERAYNRYLQDKNDAYNRYDVLKTAADTDYAKYRDSVSDYEKDLAYAREMAAEEADIIDAVQTVKTDEIVKGLPTKEEYANGKKTDVKWYNRDDPFYKYGAKGAMEKYKADNVSYEKFIDYYLNELYDKGTIDEHELAYLLDTYNIRSED